jgi:tRNA A37 threonylcarbamoyladenosine modification protein TsaB
LAFASQRPLVGISALDALAASVCPDSQDVSSYLVAAWMDARRNEVFTQLFEATRTGGGPVEPRSLEGPLVGSPANIAPRWLARAGDAPLCVVGNAPKTAEAWTRRAGPAVRFIDPSPLAGVMADLGARVFEQGLASPPHAVVPLYVRRPDAEVARDRRREVDGGAGMAATGA